MARPAVHLVVSTGLATLQWIRTGRAAPTIAPLVSGFLIDADHFYDLIRYHRGSGARGRVVLPLHGWEYLALFWLIERLAGRRLAGGLVLGYLGHLIVDQITNTTSHPLTYFLSFRWWHGFPSTLFNHPDETQVDWMQSVSGLWRHF